MDQLFELWTLWWHGPPPPDARLWGLPLYWWARIGKLLQVFAILSVLFEIIGAARLRAFSGRVLGSVNLRKALTKSIRIAVTPWNAVQSMTMELYICDDGPNDFDRIVLGIYPVMALVFWYLAAEHNITAKDMHWLSAIALGLLSGLLTPVLILFVLSVAWGILFLAVSLVTFVAAALIVVPMASLIASPRLDVGLRVVTLLAAVVGLHFDLLAS